MAHSHSHDDHEHDHPSPASLSLANRKRLRLVIVLGLGVLVLQLVGGFWANSLVLLSDAAHMSTDVASVALAYAAMHIAMRPATSSKSYGYARAEIVAAFLNAMALWVVSAYFFYEAWQRLRSPQEVDANIVIVVGAISLVANASLAFILHRGSGHNLNVRSAYLHILSDVLGSVAAVVAGLGILFFDARWLDPAATMVIGVLIVIWTFRLTRDTLHILLEGSPARVPAAEVRRMMAEMPGVTNVHDLHVWTITPGHDNLSAHIVVADASRGPEVVKQMRARLKDDYGVHHVTIQVEERGHACEGCN